MTLNTIFFASTPRAIDSIHDATFININNCANAIMNTRCAIKSAIAIDKNTFRIVLKSLHGGSALLRKFKLPALFSVRLALFAGFLCCLFFVQTARAESTIKTFTNKSANNKAYGQTGNESQTSLAVEKIPDSVVKVVQLHVRYSFFMYGLVSGLIFGTIITLIYYIFIKRQIIGK